MEALLRFSYDVLGAPKLAAAVILLVIYLIKVAVNRHDKARQNRSARITDLMEWLEGKDSIKYHFITEQAFLNRFGMLINYPLIKHFLKQSTPSENIALYIRGRRYLELSKDEQYISFIGKFTKRKVLFRKYLYLSTYCIFAFIALIMIAVLPQLPIASNGGFAIYLFTTFGFILFAGISLDESTRQDAAISLIEKYSRE